MAASPSWWDISYGPNEAQFLRLHAAPEAAAIHGTVVVIHGGYWKNAYGLDDAYGNAGTASLAPYFLERGFSVAELEYRRRDHEGGGWPGTNLDILAALKLLEKLAAEEHEDPRRAAAQKALAAKKLLIGHSAGGCLALWAAHKHEGELAVLAAAPVAALVSAYRMRVSDEGDAVELYMKCKPDTEEGLAEYMKASPAALLPPKFPLLIVGGSEDKDVPPELVRDYVKAASLSSETVSSLEVPGADHFAIVNASSEAWREQIVPALAALLRKNWGEAAGAAL